MKKIHNYKITLNEAIDDQRELRKLINNLNNDYNPRSKKKSKKEKQSFKICKKIARCERWYYWVFFEEGTFPYKDNVFKTKEEEESEEELEENKLEKIKDDYKNVLNYIEDESKSISYELFKKPFNFVSPTVLTKQLYKIKNKNKKKRLSRCN